MITQNHIIGRAVLELETGALADVWSLQEAISDLVQQRAMPAIADLCDRWVAADTVVRLDQVIVEMPVVDLQHLETDFVPRLLAALEQVLADHLADRLPIYQAPEKIIQTTVTSDWQAFLHFLEYGRLPWWGSAESWLHWCARWQAALQAEPTWQVPLRQLLATHPVVGQRLTTQFSANFRHQLVLRLQPAWLTWPALLAQVQSLIATLPLDAEVRHTLETQAWRHLWQKMATSHSASPLPMTTWLNSWLADLAQFQADMPTSIPLPQRLHREVTTFPVAEQPLWITAIAQHWPDPAPLAQPLLSPSAQQLPEHLPHQHQLLKLLAAAIALLPRPHRAQAQAIVDRILAALSLELPSPPIATDSVSVASDSFISLISLDPTLPPLATRTTLDQFLQAVTRLLPTTEQAHWQETVTRVFSLSLDTESQPRREAPLTVDEAAPPGIEPQSLPDPTAPGEAPRPQPYSDPDEPQSLSEFSASGEALSAADATSNLWPDVALESQPLSQSRIDPTAAESTTAPEALNPRRRTEALRQLLQSAIALLPSTEHPTVPQEPSPDLEYALSQLLQSAIALLPTAEQAVWATTLSQLQLDPALDAETAVPRGKLASAMSGSVAMPIGPVNAPARLSPAEIKTGLFITQAGIVLLHPFISHYFSAVELLDNEQFWDETAQQTAIYLLHYLATKQTVAPEYDLVLAKLLCNWDLNQPLTQSVTLPAATLAEGEHLLQTVIDYWQALKSTSPDGLREGFLQREGKLTRHDHGWKLQVEKQAIDILLTHLPWGGSLVKLPWMDEFLTVEWT